LKNNVKGQEEANQMTGKIRCMLDAINRKEKDNPLMKNVIKAKLVLKGIDLNRLNAQSDNDPVLIAKFESLLKELKEDYTSH
jgi:hypothetical protein